MINLTIADIIDRIDAERLAIEQALDILWLDDQRVLKGPKVGDDGSGRRIDDHGDAGAGDYLAGDG